MKLFNLFKRKKKPLNLIDQFLENDKSDGGTSYNAKMPNRTRVPGRHIFEEDTLLWSLLAFGLMVGLVVLVFVIRHL